MSSIMKGLGGHGPDIGANDVRVQTRARFHHDFIHNTTPNGRTYNFEGILVAGIRALVRG